jgi:LmbE family N-acetylglucosaminyl deacetylase
VEAGAYGTGWRASSAKGWDRYGNGSARPDVGRRVNSGGQGAWGGAGTAGADAARLLASGRPIDARVVLVVAHADDESLWAGGVFLRARDLLLIHATDSAPRDMADAARLGYARREGYAQARTTELDRALAALGVTAERRGYGLADQEAALHMTELVERLAQDLAGCDIVITHPYEGGHPDHDALALAVTLAVERLGRRGHTPAHVEFACYHLAEGERRFGRFWPDPRCPEQVRDLAGPERERINAAIAAHVTQAGVVDGWRPSVESWRAAPAYDFTAPPPPGRALYDGFSWAMTSARWRALAADALAHQRASA